MKRIATTLAAASLLALGASGVASAKSSPAGHSVRAKAAHHSVRSQAQRLGHGHHMI